MLSNVFVLPTYASRLGLDIVVFQNFAPMYADFKIIAYVHDVLFLSHPQYYSLKERIYFSPMKLLARHADRICTISESEKKRLLQYRYRNTASDIDVIYHGVDAAFKPLEQYTSSEIASIRAKYKLPANFLLFVGRLNIRKNIYHLLKAIPMLGNDSIPLVVVGFRDWKMFDIEQVLTESGIKSRVLFTGYVPDEDLPCIFAMATVFCFPSYAEGFGLPALEAMAAGVPVVVSNTTALPEVCAEAGNYVNPGNPQELASMIDRLLSDKKFYLQKRLQGLERSRYFTWEQSAKKLLQSIHKVMNVPVPEYVN
jgi:glycosyltransferase involved in cell wall biosynthesis